MASLWIYNLIGGQLKIRDMNSIRDIAILSGIWK